MVSKVNKLANDISSSSAFMDTAAFSAEWTDIQLLQRRSHNVIYTASRYGRRFLLKGLTQEAASLSDFRLMQEKEFRLGISLSHPHIATTYGLEEVPELGRCIVQEFIDGAPLTEWLATKPSKQTRERVLDQLLDAVDYLHQRQLVHHDLKSGNILITHYGANLKLIDFGLSDTDDSLSPTDNDPQADIQAMKQMIRLLFPHRYILTSNDLRRSIRRQRQLRNFIPMVVAVVLFAATASMFAIVKHGRDAEHQRYENMLALIDTYIAKERELLTPIVNQQDSYNSSSISDMKAYSAGFEDYSNCQKYFNTLRDSLTASFDENDPLREQFWQIWVRRETELHNELLPIMTGKLH